MSLIGIIASQNYPRSVAGGGGGGANANLIHQVVVAVLVVCVAQLPQLVAVEL
jgi:hypothetical protein